MLTAEDPEQVLEICTCLGMCDYSCICDGTPTVCKVMALEMNIRHTVFSIESFYQIVGVEEDLLCNECTPVFI